VLYYLNRGDKAKGRGTQTGSKVELIEVQTEVGNFSLKTNGIAIYRKDLTTHAAQTGSHAAWSGAKIDCPNAWANIAGQHFGADKFVQTGWCSC